MSDEQLIVTIGAKDSASTVIKKVNQELRYLDKEYKLAEQGSKDFDKSMDGLKSKLSMLERKYEANNMKLQAYKKQLGSAREEVEKKEEELKKLTNAEGDNSAAIEKAEKQISKYKDQMADATRNINLTELEMKNLKNEIDSTSKSIDSFKIEQFKLKLDETSKKMQETATKFKNAGKGISDVSGKLIKLGAPTVTLATVMGKAAMDFGEGIADINTLLDDETHLQSYSDAVLDLSDNFGISSKIMSAGMYQTISSIGDMGEKTQKMFGIMAKSAKAGGAEVSDSVALISAGMKGYNQINEETANKISDLAFETAKLGVTTFPEMAQSMKPLFPLANSLNIGLEELFGVMATGTGVTGNTAEVTTQYKAVLSNLMKPTKDMTDLLKKHNYASAEALIEQKGFAGVIELVKEETGGASNKMAGLFSSTEALTLMTALCGSQFDTLKEKTNAMNSAMGATDKAFDKIANTDKNKLNSALNKIQNSFIRLGGSASPIIENLAEVISEVSDSLNNMDKETINSVVKFAAFSVAIGGVGKVVGGVTSGIGSFIDFTSKATKGVGKLSEKFSKFNGDTLKSRKSIGELTKGVSLLNPVTLSLGAGIIAVSGAMAIAKTNNELMKKGISYTTDEMSALEKVVAKFNGTNFKSRKELEASGIIYKDFSKNISPEFQEKVKENTKSINNFAMKLNEINFDGVISEEESVAFVSEIDKTCTDAINAIKSRKEESNKAMQDMFISDGVIDESERRVIEIMNRSSEAQINEVTKLKEEIISIESKALEEKRSLTEGEIKLIQEKNTRIRQIELENLGKTKEEILYATNEFQERIKDIDLEGAKELVAEKAKIRDEEATKISAGYDTQIQLMKEKLSEVTGEDRKALEEQISIAETKKEELLQKNNELYDGYLSILNEKNPIVMENINKFNGEELTAADIKKQKILEKLKEQYDGINNITETGNYIMYDKINNAYSAVAVTVDENTGEIIGIYDRYTGEIGGYNDEIAKSTQNVAREYTLNRNTLISSLEDMKNNSINASGEIVDANGKVIWSLKEFKTNTDGTREGVLNLNGTPISVKANTDGAITNLKEVNNAVDNIPSRKSVTVSTFFEAVGNGIKGIFGFAKGTNYAPSGTAFVAEEGQELIEKNGKFILTGNSGPQLFNFSGGEKVYTNAETEKILSGLSNGYFNANSFKSQSLIRNNNIVSNINNQNNYNSTIDISKMIGNLAEEIKNSIIQGLSQVTLKSGDVYLDKGQIVGTVSKEFAIGTKMRR